MMCFILKGNKISFLIHVMKIGPKFIENFKKILRFTIVFCGILF